MAALDTTEQRIVEHLRSRYDPAAIVLVGSRASGAHRPSSDWDLYVLVRRPVEGGPERFEGHDLDVALVSLPIPEAHVTEVFGPNLRAARILLDDAAKVAEELVGAAARRYAAGRGLSRREQLERKSLLLRNLARMKARQRDPGAFFEAIATFFATSHRLWYEVLHDRWSIPVYEALPEIEQADPEFHAQLLALMDSSLPSRRIAAARSLYRRLFDESP